MKLAALPALVEALLRFRAPTPVTFRLIGTDIRLLDLFREAGWAS